MPDVNWKYHTTGTNRSRRYLKDKDFLVQVLIELTSKGAFLHLVLSNREGFVEVMTGGSLGHSDHEAVRFEIFTNRRKTASKTLTLGMGRADFRLLR